MVEQTEIIRVILIGKCGMLLKIESRKEFDGHR
jgi:hypothetical protein